MAPVGKLWLLTSEGGIRRDTLNTTFSLNYVFLRATHLLTLCGQSSVSFGLWVSMVLRLGAIYHSKPHTCRGPKDTAARNGEPLRPMSLYYEAADVLANPDKVGGSLKSRIYKNKESKTSPAQIFALISEASKWSPVLKDVIERCGLLAEEKKVGLVRALSKPSSRSMLTVCSLLPPSHCFLRTTCYSRRAA